jgi:hypothetical protein
MYFILFIFACYLVQWSVGLLHGDMVVGTIETYSVFFIGLLAVPAAAWIALRLIAS